MAIRLSPFPMLHRILQRGRQVVSHTPHSLQYYSMVFGNPNQNDYTLSLISLSFRDFFPHTWCSPQVSQNSYRGHSSLKTSQGGYTTLTTTPQRECGRSPVNISLLHQFMFQLRCLLTKQTWLLCHSNSFVGSNSISHSFSNLFFSPSFFTLSLKSLLPTMLYYLYGKKIFFRVASCQVWHQLILI